MTYLTAYIALRLFLSGKTATSNQLKEKHFKLSYTNFLYEKRHNYSDKVWTQAQISHLERKCSCFTDSKTLFCTFCPFRGKNKVSSKSLIRRNGDVNDLLRRRIRLSLNDWRVHLPAVVNDLVSVWILEDRLLMVVAWFSDLSLLKMPRTAFENVRLSTVLKLPIRATTLVRRSRYLVEAFVEGEVVPNGILPVACVHAVVRVPCADGLIDFRQCEHAVSRVDESFGDQLSVGHTWLGESVRYMDRPALDVLQALGLFPVLSIEDVLASVVDILKLITSS